MSYTYNKLSKYNFTKQYDFEQDRKMIDTDLINAFLGIKKSLTLIQNLPGSVPGTGDVTGPSSSVDNDIVLFNGATGKIIKDSGVLLSSLGNVFGPASSTDNAVTRFDGTTGKLIQNSNVIVDDRGVITDSITDSVGGANIIGETIIVTKTSAGEANSVIGSSVEGKFTNTTGTQGIVVGGLSKATVNASCTVTAAIGHYFEDSPTGTKTYNLAAGFGGRVVFDVSGSVPGNPSGSHVTLLPASRVLKVLDGNFQISGTAGAGQLVLGDGTNTGQTIFVSTNNGTFTPISFSTTGGGDGIISLDAVDRIKLTKLAIGDNTFTGSAVIPANGSITMGHVIEFAGNTVIDAQFDKTSTVLANVVGNSGFELVSTLVAGKFYSFIAKLFVDADATGGHKYAIGGTATATSIIYNINSIRNSTNAYTITSRQTALGGSAGEASGVAYYTEIKGTIKVNAAGTLTVQFAQNAASGTSSVLIGSTFMVKQIN